jgi:hypothetical protein
MDKNEIREVFSTRDLYLAATLVTLKFYLLGTDFQQEGDKSQMIGYFKFENSPELQETKSRYTQGLLSIEPKTFITNLKSLKSDIVNIYKNPHMGLSNEKVKYI